MEILELIAQFASLVTCGPIVPHSAPSLDTTTSCGHHGNSWRARSGEEGAKVVLDPEVQAQVLQLFQQLEQMLAQMPPEEQRAFFDEFVRDIQARVDTLYF